MFDDIIIRLYDAPNHIPLSESTIRKLIKEGRLKTVKLGARATGIMKSELDRFYAEISKETNA